MNVSRVIVAICLASAGCSASEAIQIVLTPDPSVTPLDTLLDRLDTIQVSVDAEGGLVGVEQPGARDDGSTAIDLDGDGDLEVLFYVQARGDELPILEIGLTENTGRELDFVIYGFDQAASLEPAEALALGGLTTSCPSGEVVKVGAPFNLRSWARPPQVVLVLPPDGGQAVELLSITVLLSTTVSAESAAANSRVLDPDGALIPIEVWVEDALVGQDEPRSVLTLTFEQAPGVGVHRVEVGPGLVSAAGERFDQDLKTPEEDPFHSTFSHNEIAWGSEPCDECPEGYECDEDNTGCVPVLDCSSGCADGYACDPALGFCVEDCRVFEACADPSASCDEITGLCS